MLWKSVPLRAWFATLVLGMWGLVGVGMSLQHLLHLNPCPLCIFQRLLYLCLGAVACLGVLWPRLTLLWSALLVALSGGGAAVALYQSWMQAFPELAKECSYADPNAIERLVDILGMNYPGLFLATGFCSSREWEFLGLSMANWSAVVFLSVAGGVWLVTAKNRKSS